MGFKFLKNSQGKKMDLAAVDKAIAKVSLFESVVRTSQNPDGTVVIYVRGAVDDNYDHIVQFLRLHAPGIHGQIRRAADPLAPKAKAKPNPFSH